MSQPVNLNQFRKAKARAEKRAQADENTVRFGQTKAQKSQRDAEHAKSQRDLDGHKTET